MFSKVCCLEHFLECIVEIEVLTLQSMWVFQHCIRDALTLNDVKKMGLTPA